MRAKIDYGIAFNSNFCQIARIEEGVPVVKKSDTFRDSMPLCVSYNKRGNVLVGDAALNLYKVDKIHGRLNSNSFIEFTRTLGTNHKFESSNTGKSYSSEELLAECFKKLKSFIVDEEVKSVAISVPAKFLNPQLEAVREAGLLGGFEQIELIQEPLAAKLGYGIKKGTILIFDFGISDFKVSLIINNAICDISYSVWLGGNNIVEAIVDEIIIPYLKLNFAIDSILKDSAKKEILKNAIRYFAKDAEEQLQNKISHNIISNVGDLSLDDTNGKGLEIDIEITQQDLAWVSRPIYQKAVDITIDLLKRNNLKGKDLQCICLVGEVKLSPIISIMLKNQITDNVDASIDPITAIVKGAALYASTIPVSDTIKESTRDKTKLKLDVRYETATVELDEMVNIKVLKDKCVGNLPEKIYVDIIRTDGTWSSGKKIVGEKATIIDVILAEQPHNLFEIKTYDEFGNHLECEPNQFAIQYGIEHLDKMQVLPYHIGIAKYFAVEGKELFMPIKGLEKNKRLPAIGVINGFKTTLDIRPGMANDVIRFPIYQGDYNAEGTNPMYNNHVVDIVISGESLPALLPTGSDIDFTVKVDTSQLMTFSAYIPYLNHTEELQVEIKSEPIPTEGFLCEEITKAIHTAKLLTANEVSENLVALKEQLSLNFNSADGKMKILEGLRKELLKLDGAEKVAEWVKFEKELRDGFYELEDTSNDERTLNEYRKTIEIVLKEKNLREAKFKLKEIQELLKNRIVDFNFIDNLKGELVLFYSENPGMGKERFRFLLGELIRVEKAEIGQDEKVKVVDSVKKELLKWK